MTKDFKPGDRVFVNYGSPKNKWRGPGIVVEVSEFVWVRPDHHEGKRSCSSCWDRRDGAGGFFTDNVEHYLDGVTFDK